MFCCYCYFRLDELEKLLQENIQEKETDSSDREDENVTDEDLSEEHRSFLFINQLNLVLHFVFLAFFS